jgi:hypothetical protein
MLERYWKKFKAWFLEITGFSRYAVKKADDIPDKLLKRKFYLIGKGVFIWCGVMICPCGCQKVIHLNLLPEGRPKWSYRIEKNGTISIHPSIWRKVGCKSHFFLKNGKIDWCKPHKSE